MTNSEIERRILQLEQNLANLASRQSNRANEADANNAKVEGKTETLSSAITEVEENTNTTTDTVGIVMEELLPSIMDMTVSSVDAVDFILTEVLPELMG